MATEKSRPHTSLVEYFLLALMVAVGFVLIANAPHVRGVRVRGPEFSLIRTVGAYITGTAMVIYFGRLAIRALVMDIRTLRGRTRFIVQVNEATSRAAFAIAGTGVGELWLRHLPAGHDSKSLRTRFEAARTDQASDELHIDQVDWGRQKAKWIRIETGDSASWRLVACVHLLNADEIVEHPVQFCIEVLPKGKAPFTITCEPATDV